MHGHHQETCFGWVGNIRTSRCACTTASPPRTSGRLRGAKFVAGDGASDLVMARDGGGQALTPRQRLVLLVTPDVFAIFGP